jgi:hypothetical protein
MGVMATVAGFAKIPWVPWALGAFVAYSAALGGYSYFKGASNNEIKHLKAQMKYNRKIAASDLEVVADTTAAEERMNNAIDEIELPEIPAECAAVFNDWMLTFNQAVISTGATD